MKDDLVKKGLVLGIILLFVGASVVPICNAYMDAELNYQINQPDAKDNSYATTTDFTGKNWTWLFYDDADFNNAYDPLEDFAEEAYSGENLDVIVLQDTNYGPAKIWYINENHEHVLLEEWGEVDMGDSQTLQDFLEYGKTNHPATRYILSMYDHGDGWKGACVDDTDGGWLTMNDMQQALSNTNGVDIICFTAPCGMGALESVYELRDCVDVYIGSEASSGYVHWYGTIAGICNMLNNNPDLSNIEIGEQIIQLIENNTPLPESITMSAIRTDKMEELANSIDTIAHDFINNFNESFGNVWSAYGNVQSFGGSGWCIDAYDFAEECLLVETNQSICQHLENVMNNVSEVVIAECHGNEYPDANGLSIYFPDPFKYSYDSRYADPDYELDFSQNTFWDEFLIDYLYTVFYATQDIPISNSGIINDYTATMDSDNVYECVSEMESKGKPSNRYSYLEHKWRFELTGSYTSIDFYLEAYHTSNGEGDDFVFAYSTDDVTYTDMVTVAKTTDDDTYQTFTLPDTLSGTVYIRVKDGDQTEGNRVLDTIYIDHMYIEAISEPDVTPPVISDVASSVNDNTWYNMTPSFVGGTLIPREKHAMAFDSNAECVIMFGGSRELVSNRLSDETWAYDYNSNTWFNRSSANSPAPRIEHAMAYDSESDRTIMFGGWGSGERFTGTWAYDYNTNNWTNMTLLPNYNEIGGTLTGRYGCTMVYNSYADRIILFGGNDVNFDYVKETWVYNYNNNTWYKMNPTEIGNPMPIGFHYHSMAYDEANDLTVLFGGRVDVGSSYIDVNWTYVYDYYANTWENRSSSMSIVGGILKPRLTHTMCYDSNAERTVMFAGWDGKPDRLDDTWMYDASENIWYNMNPAEVGGTLYAREESAMVYDSVNMRSIVYSGWISSTKPNRIDDTWAYDIDDLTAIITWTTDEPADSVVNYGTTALGSTESDSALVTNHQILLTDLLPDTTYYFEVQSTDESSNTAVDDNNGNYYTFFTGQDTTPPVISNVQTSGITHNSATITWGTDENSNSRVNYGTTIALGDTESDSSMVTSHLITLIGLLPETIYYYEVQSTDIKGNTATDDNGGTYYTFTTDQAPSNVMHVQSVDMWYESVKKKYNIFTKVKIVDASDNAVEGVTVYLETTLPNGDTTSVDDVTDSAGFVTFAYGPTPKKGIYTSTVTNVAKDGWTYNPDNNVETTESLVVP